MNRACAVFRLIGLLALLLPGGKGAAADTADEAARTLVLANSADPDSVHLARAYMQGRAIPDDNLFALPMSRAETITWAEFVRTIHRPLQEQLLRMGWLDAIAMDLHDAAGRRKLAVSNHRIAYLVTCRGVPLRLAHDPDLAQASGPPVPDRPEFRTNGGAVDAQLSLLAQPLVSPNGWVPNPLFRVASPSPALAARVVRVSRLDGPSPDHARALAEDALAAERDGLAGRAYVDLGGPEPAGDRWLEATAEAIPALGFPLVVHRDEGTMTADDGAEDAVLYFGWYVPELNGPFAQPGYRFARGAIALHIHSFSAQSLRDENGGGWAGPLVARGVAATFGNVGEPFLEFTHRPDLLLRALVRGSTLGEAAFLALPALGWQAIVIGDPLYRPFKVPPAAR